MKERLKNWRDRFLSALDEVERESLMEQVAHPTNRINWRVVGVVTLACVMLSWLDFFGNSGDWPTLEPLVGLFVDAPDDVLRGFFRDDKFGRLYRLGYWSLNTFVAYLVIPALFVKLVLRDSLRDFGFSVRGTIEHAWIYVVLYLVVLPFVYMVSSMPSFQETYPFYDQAGRSARDFLAWEILYALQFLSLEFFFRGFLIHGLKRRFGFYAIFLSVVPYCMIHFGKPFPEAIGSILAGIALGALSLFTGNIWPGVIIHVSVAVSMDVFALLSG